MSRRKKVVLLILAFILAAVVCCVGIQNTIKYAMGTKAEAATQINIPELDITWGTTSGTASMEPTINGVKTLVMIADFNEINRFDVVCVGLTDEQRYYYGARKVEDGHLICKRVIGLPGDTLVIIDGHLYINDELVDEEYDWYTEDSKILSSKYTLGENEYFIMGDNRTKGGSYDSRSFGAITYDQIQYVVIGTTIRATTDTLSDRSNDVNITQFVRYLDTSLDIWETYLIDIYGDWDYGDAVAVLNEDNSKSTYWLVGLPGDEIQISYNRIYVNGEETGYYETDLGFFETDSITLGEGEYYVISAGGETGKVVTENEIIGVMVVSV